MDNFLFSINVTFPIFILMLLGYFLKRIGFFKDEFVSMLNKFVFKLALPVLVFSDLYKQDFAKAWDGRFVLFCFITTVLSICIITAISFIVIKDNSRRGEFIQASYRSSAALLGLAFIQNIYGSETSSMGALMILGSVPLYNIFAVTVLTLTAQQSGKDNSSQPGLNKNLIIKTLKGIVTNPIILGIFFGILWSLLKLPAPKIISTVITDIGNLATPLGLMAMGGSFEFKKATKELIPSLVASFMKLFGLAIIFLPVSIALGYRNEQLIALLVMYGSATTVSCFIMAKNMGHEGTLSSGIIMMTTLGCSFSLTFWLFVLKSLGVI
ncbi:MAG: AEC family transporter [Butyrivibrio sp.]|nr:AEC family transporter [Butyrivibrio sp.]